MSLILQTRNERGTFLPTQTRESLDVEIPGEVSDAAERTCEWLVVVLSLHIGDAISADAAEHVLSEKGLEYAREASLAAGQ